MIEQTKARLATMTAGFTLGQKVMMGLAFIGVVGGLWMFSNWASTTDMAPLFTDLETADAASIAGELDSQGVPYELTDQGRTVLVPRDRVYELRLDMSTAGVTPNGGAQGYSLLDEQGITSTQFQQRVAFQRALEGELAMTIRSIDSIDAASVHLVIPRDDLFVGDDIESTASVLVQTRATLAPEQVQAIVNLVAGSVEGLRADAVTVADQTGLVLAAPGQTPFDRAGAGGSASQTVAFESDLAAEIQNMLTAVVGPGNALVTVSAQMDWDASSTVSEVHTPSGVADGEQPLLDRQATTSEQYNTTASDGDGGTLGGGADADTDRSSESTYSNEAAEQQFKWDSVVTSQDNSGGDIEKLNVAVLINETSSTQAQLTEIEDLVSSAAGIDAERGDTIAVSRLAFDETIQEAITAELEASTAATESAAAGDMLRTIVLGILGFLIVVIAGVQLWRARASVEEVEELDLATLTNTLTAGAARQAATTAAAAPIAAPRTPAVPVEDDSISPTEELQMLVDQQPDEVARLLRTWLADRRAVAR